MEGGESLEGEEDEVLPELTDYVRVDVGRLVRRGRRRGRRELSLREV